MLDRVARGAAVLGLTLLPLLAASAASDAWAVILLSVYGLPAIAAGIAAERLNSALAAPTFIAALALQTLALAWWVGGGRTWGRRLLRGLAVAALVYGSVAILLLLLVLSAAASGL